MPLPDCDGQGRECLVGGTVRAGDAVRLEAFSDGVLAIAITPLILEVRVEQAPGQSLAEALRQALPEIGAYAVAGEGHRE